MLLSKQHILSLSLLRSGWLRQTRSRICCLLLLLFLLPSLSFAYDDKTTHPALTDEIVDLFNLYYPKLKISDAEKELIKKGSIDEDAVLRALNHFYDPVYNRGLWNNLSSKDWAQNTLAQAGIFRPFAGAFTGIFGAPTDYSWDRAVYDLN